MNEWAIECRKKEEPSLVQGRDRCARKEVLAILKNSCLESLLLPFCLGPSSSISSLQIIIDSLSTSLSGETNTVEHNLHGWGGGLPTQASSRVLVLLPHLWNSPRIPV